MKIYKKNKALTIQHLMEVCRESVNKNSELYYFNMSAFFLKKVKYKNNLS